MRRRRSIPGAALEFNGARDDATCYAVAQPRYRDEELSPEPQGQQLPAFAPRPATIAINMTIRKQDGADDQSYAAEDYDEDERRTLAAAADLSS